MNQIKLSLLVVYSFIFCLWTFISWSKVHKSLSFSSRSIFGHRRTESREHSDKLRLIRVNLFALQSLTGQHVVRIMFSQVLIHVWREVQEFIIHLTGGRSLSWDAARSEASLLLAYWHVPFVMNTAEVHLRNSPVRQPSWQRNTARSIHTAHWKQGARSQQGLVGNWAESKGFVRSCV